MGLKTLKGLRIWPTDLERFLDCQTVFIWFSVYYLLLVYNFIHWLLPLETAFHFANYIWWKLESILSRLELNCCNYWGRRCLIHWTKIFSKCNKINYHSAADDLFQFNLVFCHILDWNVSSVEGMKEGRKLPSLSFHTAF